LAKHHRSTHCCCVYPESDEASRAVHASSRGAQQHQQLRWASTATRCGGSRDPATRVHAWTLPAHAGGMHRAYACTLHEAKARCASDRSAPQLCQVGSLGGAVQTLTVLVDSLTSVSPCLEAWLVRCQFCGRLLCSVGVSSRQVNQTAYGPERSAVEMRLKDFPAQISTQEIAIPWICLGPTPCR